MLIPPPAFSDLFVKYFLHSLVIPSQATPVSTKLCFSCGETNFVFAPDDYENNRDKEDSDSEEEDTGSDENGQLCFWEGGEEMMMPLKNQGTDCW